MGFDVLEWGDLARGARPDYEPMVDRLPGTSRQGWQEKVSDAVEQRILGWECLAHSRTQLNWLSFVPSKVPWRDFRSLACPSPWSRGFNDRSSGFCSSVAFGNPCPCLRSPADVADHLILVAIIAQRVRWQECWGAEEFRWRMQSLACCREAGGRVTTNVRVQDMDLLPLRQVDNRRLEVVVDGLPLFRGAQLAIDTTMVSPVRSDGTAGRQCATVSGAALDQARRRKERTYPELAQQHGRARLVVLGCDVGGRWSEESRQFLASHEAAKARSEPELMRKSTMFCWLASVVHPHGLHRC